MIVPMFTIVDGPKVEMTDSVQRKRHQRADIMLKICELAERSRPEHDPAMSGDDEHRVVQIYKMLSRAMDLPEAVSWLDD
jgi:hypothetical protein